MNNKDKPAMPIVASDVENVYELGLTKLEYLTAKAMEGDWSAQSTAAGVFYTDTSDETLRARSQLYIRHAKITLEELEKEKHDEQT